MSHPLVIRQSAFEALAKIGFPLRYPTAPASSPASSRTSSALHSGAAQELLSSTVTMSNTSSFENPTSVVLRPRRSDPYPHWKRSAHQRDREGGIRRQRGDTTIPKPPDISPTTSLPLRLSDPIFSHLHIFRTFIWVSSGVLAFPRPLTLRTIIHCLVFFFIILHHNLFQHFFAYLSASALFPGNLHISCPPHRPQPQFQ